MDFKFSKFRCGALLVTDLVASTKMLCDDEEVALRQLKRFFSGVTYELRSYAGSRMIKGLGDGFLAAFADVESAADFAFKMVTLADELNVDQRPEQSIYPRQGIHWTSFIDEGRDIFGLGVNMTVRIADMARPGELTISSQAWRQRVPNSTLRGKCIAKNAAHALMVYGMTYRKALPDPDDMHKPALH